MANHKLNMKSEEKYLGLFFVAPVVLFVIVFGIIPVITSVGYSFTDWDGMSTHNFVGLKNYINAIVYDDVSRKAIFNTLELTLVCVVLNLLIGYAAANFLFKTKGRLAETGKIILFIPYILSFAAVGVLFSFIFGSTDMGLLNKILMIFNIAPFPWFGSEYTAMLCIILTYVWKDFGFSLLLFYAGLQSMPVSLLEAAEIDGATQWQKTVFIKIPYLKPVTQTLIVLGIIRYMLTFTIVMFLTPDGGPNKTTEVVASWFYKQSFNFMQLGYGASLAVILSIILMIVTVVIRGLIKVEEV